MAKLSNETISGLSSGIITKSIDGPWTDDQVKSVHGSGVGPKMVQLFTQEAEVDANLSTGLDSDDDWQYDDKRDKGNFPITHAVRVDDNNLYFRSEGVSNIPVGQLEFNGLGIIADGTLNTSTTRSFTSTSESTPYTIEGSEVPDTGRAPWEAFNNLFDPLGDWDTTTTGFTTDGWLRINFGTDVKIINKYRIFFQLDRGVSAWDIEGSDNGTDWTTLHSVTGNTIHDAYTPYQTFTNSTAYQYIRIFFPSGSAIGGHNRLIIKDIELIDAPIPTNVQVGSIDAGGIELLTSTLSLSGSTQGQALNDIMTAINNGPTDVTATQSQDHPERITLTGTDATFSDAPITVTTQAVDLTKLTDFTSYDDGSVVVLGPEIPEYDKLDLSTGVTYFHSSSEEAGYEAEKAFNGVLTLPDYWQIPSGAGHVGVDLGVGKGRTVVRYRLSSTGSNTMPDVFTFEGKQVADGPWTVLDSVSYTPVENELSEYFLIDSPANYEMYRINVTATTGNAINVIRIIELEMDAINAPQAEDTLGIFSGAQIVDTFDNTYHITDITTVEGVSGSDKSQITVLETLPIDAEWEVKRIANVEQITSSLVEAPTERPNITFANGSINSGSLTTANIGGSAIYTISEEDYALSIGTSVKFSFNTTTSFDGIGFIRSDIAVDGFDRTNTGLGSFALFLDGGSATSPAYAYIDGVSVPVNISNHGTGTFYIVYVGDGAFDFYKNDTTFLGQVSSTLQDNDRVKLAAQSNMSSAVTVVLSDWSNYFGDSGFGVTTSPTISGADRNHFHTLAPNGNDANFTKPSTTSQITNFGFRLPDNSASSVDMQGEEGYMAFATKFNLDMTPKNCVIYNKTLEQRETIATSIASDRGGLGEDGDWWYRNISVFSEIDGTPTITQNIQTDPFNDPLNGGSYQTNNSTPYTITASNSRTGGAHEPYNTMDGNTQEDQWESDTGISSGWIKVDLGVANNKTFGAYRVTQISAAIQNGPDDWTLEGSNTGTFSGEEVVLDTQTGQNGFISASAYHTVPPGNQGSYRFYRLNMSDNGGGARIALSGLEFFEATGGNFYESSFSLLSSNVSPASLGVKDNLDVAFTTTTPGQFNVEVDVDGAGYDSPRDMATFITEEDITVVSTFVIKLTAIGSESVSEISIGGQHDTWSPSPSQARAFASALDSDIANRNPATYFTYEHPDILTQEQWGKLFFDTNKFAPYIGVRSINGGAPYFTNIWAQFASSLKDIKLGTGSVEVTPTIGSTEIQLKNVSGNSIEGQVVAYILG